MKIFFFKFTNLFLSRKEALFQTIPYFIFNSSP